MFDFNNVDIYELNDYLRKNIRCMSFHVMLKKYIKITDFNRVLYVLTPQEILMHDNDDYSLAVEKIKEYLDKYHNYQIIKF